MSEIPLGRFVWYQLNATDLDAAVAFYTRVVGWSTDLWHGADGDPYTLFQRGGEAVAGAMAMPPEAVSGGAPQHWLPYVAAPDVDRSVSQACDHGAQVHVPPTDLPEIGRFAVIADPQGAAIALYAPASAPDDEPFDPQVGEASWHELMTGDHAAALSFYAELFGWEETGVSDIGDLGQYRMFGRHGRSVGGMFDQPSGMRAPPHWLVYFRVDDVRAGAENVTANGGQVLSGPMEVPGGDLVVRCNDPQGGVFALHSVAAG